jgi:histidinol-phosphate aminotransferase
MSVSRRAFVRTLGVGGAGALSLPAWLNARGMEAGSIAGEIAPHSAAEPGIIKLDSNENPNGPVPAAIRAVRESMRSASLYPDRNEQPLRDAIAKVNGLAPNQVMIGCGSTEILRLAVQAFCSPTKHVVTALPSFETPGEYAGRLGFPVREVPLGSSLELDLDAMLAQVKGAGLVYLCNPNNPTAHAHGAVAVRTFVAAALAADPDVIVVVDEAYHEFVEDPSYATAIPLIATNPRVFVARTFSKIYGMAGMRLGYAMGAPETIAKMERLSLPSGIGGLTLAAGIEALADPAQVKKEQLANHESRKFTMDWFAAAGYSMVPSQANFLLVRINRSPGGFKEACAREGVLVGRVFPRLPEHGRISIGTLDEMHRAVRVFKLVLG